MSWIRISKAINMVVDLLFWGVFVILSVCVIHCADISISADSSRFLSQKHVYIACIVYFSITLCNCVEWKGALLMYRNSLLFSCCIIIISNTMPLSFHDRNTKFCQEALDSADWQVLNLMCTLLSHLLLLLLCNKTK